MRLINLWARVAARFFRRERAVKFHCRHPLMTSARKMKLYTAREHLRFLFRAIFDTRRAMGSRESAHIWSDGRR
jgi:hypothetical protein